MSRSRDIDDTIAKAEGLVHKAADAGAHVILLQELFETPYRCLEQDPQSFDIARPLEDSRVVRHFGALG